MNCSMCRTPDKASFGEIQILHLLPATVLFAGPLQQPHYPLSIQYNIHLTASHHPTSNAILFYLHHLFSLLHSKPTAHMPLLYLIRPPCSVPTHHSLVLPHKPPSSLLHCLVFINPDSQLASYGVTTDTLQFILNRKWQVCWRQVKVEDHKDSNLIYPKRLHKENERPVVPYNIPAREDDWPKKQRNRRRKRKTRPSTEDFSGTGRTDVPEKTFLDAISWKDFQIKTAHARNLQSRGKRWMRQYSRQQARTSIFRMNKTGWKRKVPTQV